jgi:hypothetical protein
VLGEMQFARHGEAKREEESTQGGSLSTAVRENA